MTIDHTEQPPQHNVHRRLRRSCEHREYCMHTHWSMDVLLVRSLGRRNLLLLLGKALGEECLVLGLLLLLVFDLAGLDGGQVAAALVTLGRDEALDFGTIII